MEDIFQVGLDDFVVDFAARASAFEETAALHESQVFGGHGGWDLAGLSKLRDGEVLGQEHLEHTESVWVSQDFEALGSLAERFEACEFDFGGRHDGFVGLGWFGLICLGIESASDNQTVQYIGISLTIQYEFG